MENVQFQHYTDFVGELTVRYRRTSVPNTTITKSKDAIDFIRPYFEECMDDHEEFLVMHLNNANAILNVHYHTVGGTTGTLIDAKLIFQQALLIKCTAILIIHNHPSGKLEASMPDVKMSQQLKEGSKLLGLKLLDSLIITREGYVSLSDEGLI